MANGIVKFFNSAKGFGFITPEGGGKDVFIPATSIASSGVSGLKAGQLVSFETEPDSKGPKAVKLKILAEAPKQVPPREVRERPAPQPTADSRLTLYFNPASDQSQTVLDTLRELGREPHLVDYIATPPTRDELRNLSMQLREADQSLARRYDTLFLELQLDDRFISENEFWTAIVEHPTLINGPVLATATKARICRTENAVRSFLGLEPAAEKRTAKVAEVKAAPEKEKAQKSAPKAEAKAAAGEKAPAPKKSKPEPKVKAAPKVKTAAKAKKTVKKAAPIKKTRRA